jgi:hypothetical protein
LPASFVLKNWPLISRKLFSYSRDRRYVLEIFCLKMREWKIWLYSSAFLLQTLIISFQLKTPKLVKIAEKIGLTEQHFHQNTYVCFAKYTNSSFWKFKYFYCSRVFSSLCYYFHILLVSVKLTEAFNPTKTTAFVATVLAKSADVFYRKDRKQTRLFFQIALVLYIHSCRTMGANPTIAVHIYIFLSKCVFT